MQPNHHKFNHTLMYHNLLL